MTIIKRAASLYPDYRKRLFSNSVPEFPHY
jgi:hypothetical protein